MKVKNNIAINIFNEKDLKMNAEVFLLVAFNHKHLYRYWGGDFHG